MKHTVLVVEDEPLFNMAISEFLQLTGFDVVSCYSASDALETLEQASTHFDCLITDIRLGKGPTGWVVGKHTREVNPTAAVIYMSGDSASEWSQFGVKDSIMLTKPMAFERLNSAILTLLHDKKPE